MFKQIAKCTLIVRTEYSSISEMCPNIRTISITQTVKIYVHYVHCLFVRIFKKLKTNRMYVYYVEINAIYIAFQTKYTYIWKIKNQPNVCIIRRHKRHIYCVPDKMYIYLTKQNIHTFCRQNRCRICCTYRWYVLFERTIITNCTYIMASY